MNYYFKKHYLLLIPAIMAFNASLSQEKKPGIDTSFMDKSVKPSDDFFRYVNGTWLDKTEIPNDKTRWGSFDELAQNTDKDALTILKEAANNTIYKSDSDQGKAINLYRAVLDTVARNKQGITPLKSLLADIDAIKKIQDLQNLLIENESLGGLGFFGIYIGADSKDSNKNVLTVTPGALGLPDRDYYVSEDKDSKEKRALYVLHVAKMLQFLGEKPAVAKSHAEQLLAFETKMSAPRFDRVEERDSRKSYNPMSVADLQKLTPSINWKQYFSGIGILNLDSVVVDQPKYMQALEMVLNENKVDDWKNYMRWTLLNNNADKLSTNIEKANWEFYGKTLTGAKKQRPYEEKALQVVNYNIGEALGKLYVEKKFPAEAKTKAEKMIRNIILAYENRIGKLAWMSPSTKKSAIDKLHKVTIKIGYPETWEDYAALTIKNPAEGGNYYEDSKNIAMWNFKKSISKLYKPVNKKEWLMSPQTVNAYYNPSYNEIVFPAAILQPPFYDYRADEAVNYGGIGAVIGHELSHGFDDSGARYNADGNLVDWWNEEDLKQFTRLSETLAAQFNVLEPLPGIHVDGAFTLGENIGDLGGVNVAYDALKLFLKENGNPGLIDGYTPEQRFFISWATVWRTKTRDEALKKQVKTDPHSPAMYRSYVPLQNIDGFYEAFKIKKGDGMFIEPENRVKIW